MLSKSLSDIGLKFLHRQKSPIFTTKICSGSSHKSSGIKVEENESVHRRPGHDTNAQIIPLP